MTSSEDCRVTSVSPTPKDTEAEEAIAKVLREHQRTTGMAVSMGWTCRCGVWVSNSRFWEHQAEVIAAVLAASPAVTGQDERAKAETWPAVTSWDDENACHGAHQVQAGHWTMAPHHFGRCHSDVPLPAAAPSPAVTAAEDETPAEHFARCRCHDSWDQCPCADSGHPADRSCGCCPLGTGICGPWPQSGPRVMVDAPREVVERFTNDQAHALGVPGFAPPAPVVAAVPAEEEK